MKKIKKKRKKQERKKNQEKYFPGSFNPQHLHGGRVWGGVYQKKLRNKIF